MHLILTGATGLVGTATLSAMLSNPSITKITLLTRRPVPLAENASDPRVNTILHSDFTNYPPELLSQIRDATGCVWALGVSQNQVGREEYVKITRDFPLAFAKAFQSQSATTHSDMDTDELKRKEKGFNFVHASGYGATFSPGRFTPLFGRVKGETELALAEMRRATPQFKASTVRPCAIDWTRHDAIKSFIPSQGMLGGKLGDMFFKGVSAVGKTYWSPTEQLGRFLVDMAMVKWEDDSRIQGKGVEVLEGGFKVVENWGFMRLAGLDGK